VCDRLGANIAASACPVLDHELLAEPLREPLCDQAEVEVVAVARWKADDYAYRPRRVGLRRRVPCGLKNLMQRSSAAKSRVGEMVGIASRSEAQKPNVLPGIEHFAGSTPIRPSG
jgi:hypothetical protein